MIPETCLQPVYSHSTGCDNMVKSLLWQNSDLTRGRQKPISSFKNSPNGFKIVSETLKDLFKTLTVAISIKVIFGHFTGILPTSAPSGQDTVFSVLKKPVFSPFSEILKNKLKNSIFSQKPTFLLKKSIIQRQSYSKINFGVKIDPGNRFAVTF